MEDAALLAAFFDGRLPKDEWTHTANLRVGLMVVRQLGRSRALETLRVAIQQLNLAHGVENSDTGGYHETVTRAWVAILDDELRSWNGPDDTQELLLASPGLASPARLLRHYSRERLATVEARRTYVGPDLSPLPEGPDSAEPS